MNEGSQIKSAFSRYQTGENGAPGAALGNLSDGQ